MEYKIIDVLDIKLAHMRIHPDALAIGASEDDRSFLGCSVEDVGVLEPLTVIDNDGADYLIIDGAGRYGEAGRLGLVTVPCLVVECDNVRDFVMNKNPMGRKRSTGSRLLCFGMLHQDDVFRGYLGSRDPRVCQKADDALKKWLPGKIANRLSVGRKDVTLAAELLYCHVKDIDLDGIEIVDDAVRTKLRMVFNQVLQGELPVRRWRSAFAGALSGTQAGTAGKAQTDYGCVMERALTSLDNAWSKWPEFELDDAVKRRVHYAFAEVIEHAPPTLRESATLALLHWPEGELKALAKKINKQLGCK